MYIFGRSGSSISNQALYASVGVEHLQALNISSIIILFYRSKMRVGIGM